MRHWDNVGLPSAAVLGPPDTILPEDTEAAARKESTVR